MITLSKMGAAGGPQRIVMLGDSITANTWFSYFAAAVEAKQALATAGSGGLPGGPFPRVAQATAFHTWLNSGVAGDDCIIETTPDAATVVQNRVTKYAPDVVFVMLGVNCVIGSLSDGLCTTNHGAILTAIKAQNPGVQIAVLSILCKGESWPNGANPADAAITSKNAAIAAVAATAGATYIDLRTPFFAFEAINNPTNLQILGPITNSDASAVHPNQTVGAPFLRDAVMPYIQFA